MVRLDKNKIQIGPYTACELEEELKEEHGS